MNRFRYSSSHNLYSFLSQPPKSPPLHTPTLPPETLVSLSPSSIDFSTSIRFHTNPSCTSTFPLVSSIGSSSHSALASPFHIKFRSLHLCRGGYIDKGLLVSLCLANNRCYGTSGSVEQCGTSNVGVNEGRWFASFKQFRDILGMIRRNDEDLEYKLGSMNVSLNLDMCRRVFEELNKQERDALAMCDWIRYAHPSCRNDVRSMVIDNLGRLGSYEAMARVLSEFSKIMVYLVPLAFEFVSLSTLKEATVKKVVGILKEVKDPTRGSGLGSLIKMLSSLGLFDMAELVMQLSERKLMFYKIMVVEKCGQGDLKGAADLVEVMRQHGFGPDAKIYNYVLSNLFKHDRTAEAVVLFDEMLRRNPAPDPITYEIFVCHLCEAGNFDMVKEILDRMNKSGSEPRASMHAFVLKSYFNLMRFEEAYEYALACDRYICFPEIFSTLARLYVKANKVVIAHNDLLELIDRGLRPDHSVYLNVFRRLIHTGRTALAEDLRSRMSRIGSKLTMEVG